MALASLHHPQIASTCAVEGRVLAMEKLVEG